jgi:hypothetical protein
MEDNLIEKIGEEVQQTTENKSHKRLLKMNGSSEEDCKIIMGEMEDDTIIEFGENKFHQDLMRIQSDVENLKEQKKINNDFQYRGAEVELDLINRTNVVVFTAKESGCEDIISLEILAKKIKNSIFHPFDLYDETSEDGECETDEVEMDENTEDYRDLIQIQNELHDLKHSPKKEDEKKDYVNKFIDLLYRVNVISDKVKESGHDDKELQTFVNVMKSRIAKQIEFYLRPEWEADLSKIKNLKKDEDVIPSWYNHTIPKKDFDKTIRDYENLIKRNSSFDFKVGEEFELIFSFETYFRRKNKIALNYQKRSSMMNYVRYYKQELQKVNKILNLVQLNEEEYDRVSGVTMNYLSPKIKLVPDRLQNLILVSNTGKNYQELLNDSYVLKSKINSLENDLQTVEYDITTDEVLLEDGYGVNNIIALWLKESILEKYDVENITFAIKKVNGWISIGIIYDHKEIIHRDVYFYREEMEEAEFNYLFIVNKLLKQLNKQ